MRGYADIFTVYRLAKRYPHPLITFGHRHNLPCCPLSNAFEAATGAYAISRTGQNQKP